MSEIDLLKRITVNPRIFGGKPIVRGDASRSNTSWACWQLATPHRRWCKPIHGWRKTTSVLVYSSARKVVGEERIEPLIMEPAL